MITVWKLSIKPDPKEKREAMARDAFDLCKDKGLVGVGWSEALEGRHPSNEEEAFEMVKKYKRKGWDHKDLPYGIRVLFKEVKKDHHIWIHQGGKYYTMRRRFGQTCWRTNLQEFLGA